MKPKIEGAIIQNGRMYKAGDEDAFASVLTAEALGRLTKGGQISGDWEPRPVSAANGGEPEGKPPVAQIEAGPKTQPAPAAPAPAKRNRSRSRRSK